MDYPTIPFLAHHNFVINLKKTITIFRNIRNGGCEGDE
jgi:hypothetical protein